MSHDSQREQSIEQLLRQGAGRAALPADTAQCLDGEVLAAWSSGALPGTEAARVETHVADCLRCQAMVAAFVRTDTAAEPAPAHAWWHLRWLVPLATAAIVVAVWVAVPDRSPARFDSTGPPPVTEAQPRVAAPEPVPPAPTAALAESPAPVTSGPTARTGPPVEPRRDSSEGARVAAGAVTAPGTATPPPPSAAMPLPPAARDQPRAVTQRPAELRAMEERVAAPAPAPVASVSAPVVEVRSPNGPSRWRFAASGPLERSLDGGATWQAIDLLSPEALRAGHSPGGTVAWLVGRGGVVYVTTDGTRFARVPFVEAVDLTAVVAIDDRQATVTAADGRTLTTTDRGSTWK